MEVADQDEILFADLNKQISLLIMDDDTDQYLPYPPVTYQVCIIHKLSSCMNCAIRLIES